MLFQITESLLNPPQPVRTETSPKLSNSFLHFFIEKVSTAMTFICWSWTLGSSRVKVPPQTKTSPKCTQLTLKHTSEYRLSHNLLGSGNKLTNLQLCQQIKEKIKKMHFVYRDHQTWLCPLKDTMLIVLDDFLSSPWQHQTLQHPPQHSGKYRQHAPGSFEQNPEGVWNQVWYLWVNASLVSLRTNIGWNVRASVCH